MTRARAASPATQARSRAAAMLPVASSTVSSPDLPAAGARTARRSRPGAWRAPAMATQGRAPPTPRIHRASRASVSIAMGWSPVRGTRVASAGCSSTPRRASSPIPGSGGARDRPCRGVARAANARFSPWNRVSLWLVAPARILPTTQRWALVAARLRRETRRATREQKLAELESLRVSVDALGLRRALEEEDARARELWSRLRASGRGG